MLEMRVQVETESTGGDSIGPGFDPEMFRTGARRMVSVGTIETAHF